MGKLYSLNNNPDFSLSSLTFGRFYSNRAVRVTYMMIFYFDIFHEFGIFETKFPWIFSIAIIEL